MFDMRFIESNLNFRLVDARVMIWGYGASLFVQGVQMIMPKCNFMHGPRGRALEVGPAT